MGIHLSSEYYLMPFLVLLIDVLFMIILFKTRRKMKRQNVVVFSLTAACIAGFMNIFSEYTLDFMHVLSHLMFSIVLLLCANLLRTERLPAFFRLFGLLELNLFDRFQYSLAKTTLSFCNKIRYVLELNLFDRFQYSLAKKVVSLSSNIRKTQTGNLNINMIGVMIGFIICFLLPFFLGLVG
jgi:hypothetical protein